MRLAVAGVVATAVWSWGRLRRLWTARGRGSTSASRPSETRRRYVFGAITRETFETAMRKTGWRSSRGRSRGGR